MIIIAHLVKAVKIKVFSTRLIVTWDDDYQITHYSTSYCYRSSHIHLKYCILLKIIKNWVFDWFDRQRYKPFKGDGVVGYEHAWSTGG